jgi:hypothetical protein
MRVREVEYVVQKHRDEKYNGPLFSAWTPSTTTTGEIPVNQAGALGMPLRTEDHYTKSTLNAPITKNKVSENFLPIPNSSVQAATSMGPVVLVQADPSKILIPECY